MMAFEKLIISHRLIYIVGTIIDSLYWVISVTYNHTITIINEGDVDGSTAALAMPCIRFNNESIERVNSFKLMGVAITNDLTWANHIAAICSKANKRLHFLTLLRRAAASRADMLYYYTTVIRPVIEYACPLWQSSLTGEQKHQLEHVHQRAVYIITGSSDYELQCALLVIELICLCLDRLARSFFDKLRNTDSCQRSLLPPERPFDVTNKLRRSKYFSVFLCHTESYKRSFLPFAISNYQ
jgi:hypothetical protein